MRVEPKSKTHTFTGKPIKAKNYKEIAAVIVAFLSIFYFIVKVVIGI